MATGKMRTGLLRQKKHPCCSRCRLTTTWVGKGLDTEDAPPEIEGKIAEGEHRGAAIMQQSRGDHNGRANYHIKSDDTWRHILHDLLIRLRVPHEMSMGIRLVMSGGMLVWGLPLRVMVCARVYCITVVSMGGAEMRKKHKRRRATKRMVNQHMR